MKLKQLFSIVLFSLAGASHAAPPAKQFFANAVFSDARLSPSGRYVGLRVGDDSTRDSLVIMTTDTMKVVGSARLDREDIGNFRWLNDNRLVFTINDRTVAPGDVRYAPGLFAMDRDGGNLRRLAHRNEPELQETGTIIKSRVQPWNTYLMDQEGPQDSDIIHVERPIWREGTEEQERTDLVKLNTSTGEATAVSRPGTAQGWLLDQKGEPRIMLQTQQARAIIHYKDHATGNWRQVAEFNAYDPQGGFHPLGFIDDVHLLVASQESGKSTLRTFDLSTGKMDEKALVSMAEFDFSGELIYTGNKLAGVHYLIDGRGTVWFDAAMKAVQQDVDALLPATTNLVTPPRQPQTPWVLVKAYSDRQPTVFMLYNTQSKQLAMLGGSHPEIQPGEMGTLDLLKYKARDGLTIPAWLTLPKSGGKNLPMVVLVHGGPYLRGTEWQWDAESQFLASRGYAVLAPEFRGSTGYGNALFSAGKKQWGLTMQDDIADAVKFAVAQGIADPKRICLMGGSYGGYATLMGLVKDQDLYQCGVAYAAVTDIPLMFDSGAMVLSDMSDQYKKYGAPELIGDLEKDAQQFITTSPLKQAARIKRPLLLAHGTNDVRVPFVHFKKMRAALESNQANAEFVEYVSEGHGWSLLKTRLDFWTRVEKFLDKHIGAAAK
ncbi:MAG: alpha/beta fold hydrolase [Burkholderiaceae bacterium]|nr:alpha/beta fold hydrolase [Burkholderiaceae bacterium]